MERMASMTTTTASPRNARRPREGGFTLVEVMVASSLGLILLAAVLTTILFLGRSGANVANYADMETEARNALEVFAQDTRQASAIKWNSATSIDLVVNSKEITYSYNSGTGEFVRTEDGVSRTLLTGIVSFNYKAYKINTDDVVLSDLSTAAKRTAASNVTKQIQISLNAVRETTTAATATNTVLSARYILRNKIVTT